MTPPSYRRAFWKSSHHAWLAALALGGGFATGEPLGLLAGAVVYALGVLYLPDTAFFKRSVDTRAQAATQAADAARRAEFIQQRDQLLATLSTGRRTRHVQLAGVCRDIETATADSSAGPLALSLETRLRKLDELMWTFLRLLTIEQSLEVYLETERREQLPAACKSAEAEVESLAADLADAPKDSSTETRRKLLQSRRDRLDALRQRLHRVEQSQANLDLVRSEQERLVEQVKLIRADAIANKNAEALTARIDLSIEHLAETNRWLSELADFKDLTGSMPSGLSAAAPTTTASRLPGSAGVPPATEKN